MTINLNQAETSRDFWEKARLKQAVEVVEIGSSQELSKPHYVADNGERCPTLQSVAETNRAYWERERSRQADKYIR